MQTATVCAVVYGSGVYYASIDDKFNRLFTKYVPLAGVVMDFLEEREYQNNIASRARRAQLESESQDSYYYRRSPVSSAVENVSSSSALTSNRSEEHPAGHKQTQSSSNATSATSSKDPLSPKRFFDAVSGTVGGDRDYLPLVLLPDDQDAVLNKAAMSLNALISSFNASAISEETVLKVSKTLADVAKTNASVAPRYSQVIMYKSDKFDRLYRNYRLIWEEYLDTQEQISSTKSTPTSNPVLADYSKKLSEEITETELLLVNLINSGKRGQDLDITDPQFIKYKNYTASLKKKKLALAQQPTLPVGPAITAPPPAPKPHSPYGAFDGTEISLQLKLALTLLVTALQQQSHVPLGPYIQGVREAMASYPENKEGLIHEALKGITIPENVDLEPVLHDILTYDSGRS